MAEFAPLPQERESRDLRSERLDDDEVATVLQRAAELDSAGRVDGGTLLDVAALEQVGREVGLSAEAVRQAVNELRDGQLTVPRQRRPAPALLVVERTVPGEEDEVTAAVEAFLRRQWFDCRRRRGERSEWCPRRGLVADVRRSLDLTSTLRLNQVGRLVLSVRRRERTRTHVRFEADMRGYRRTLLGVGVGVGGSFGAGAAAIGAVIEPTSLLWLLPAGAGATALGWSGGVATYRRREGAVEETLEGFLDQLASPRQDSMSSTYRW